MAGRLLERKHGESEREIFSLDEFVEIFNTKDLNKSSGVFNRDKLIWFNHQYIAHLQVEVLVKKYGEWHAKYSDNLELRASIAEKGEVFLTKVLTLIQTRLKLLSDIDEAVLVFYQDGGKADFSKNKHTKNIAEADIQVILSDFVSELSLKREDISDWSHTQWEVFMREKATSLNLGAGKVFMTLRLALTNSSETPPLYEILQVLGKQEVLTRLSKYVDNK